MAFFWKSRVPWPVWIQSPSPDSVVSPLKYLMIQQTPFVRRQVRKLLLFICGSKEKYRQLRDLHTLDSHVRGIKKLLEEQGIFLRASVVTASSGSALQYDTLISLVRPCRGWGDRERLGQVVKGWSRAHRASQIRVDPSYPTAVPHVIDFRVCSFPSLSPPLLGSGSSVMRRVG